MGAVLFYHLTQRPLEATLPILLNKSLEANWRVVVRGRNPTLLERLDRKLWEIDGFIPHGMAGGAYDALQPVLLTTDGNAPNMAKCLISVDGADITDNDVGSMERVCIVFDGADTPQLEHARDQWRNMTAKGLKAQYWAEEDGRWIKKAES